MITIEPLADQTSRPYRLGKHPCGVCGKTDEKKPMCFVGEEYCSDLHRKILNGELGIDISVILNQGLITDEQATRLWGKNLSYKQGSNKRSS